MRQQGQIKDWKDDKGFGFVVPLAAGAEPAFVHINSFLNRQRRPVDGDLISYEAVQDFQKRWQAQAIRYVDELPKDVPMQAAAPEHRPASSGSTWSALPLLRVLLVLLVLGILGLVGYQVLQPRSTQAASRAQTLVAPAAATTAQDPPVPAQAPPTPEAMATVWACERQWCSGG